MNVRILAVVTALLTLTVCTVAIAETTIVSLDAVDTPIVQAMADISKQAGVQIVCDSDVEATINAQFGSIELEKLLDAVTKSNNLVWRKFYITVKPDETLNLQTLKSRVSAIEGASGESLVVCDPVTGKQKVFLEQDAKSQSVDPDKMGMKPLYLISKSKTEDTASDNADEPAKRLQSIQNERLKILASMTPEERQAAFQQEMAAMINMDPAARTQLMNDEMNARRNLPPELQDAYRQMMRGDSQQMQDRSGSPRRNPGEVNRGDWQNRRDQRNRSDGGATNRRPTRGQQ